MPRPYICLKKSMETQEQKFTRELANSRMQIELLRNQVLLRYYAPIARTRYYAASQRSENAHEQH